MRKKGFAILALLAMLTMVISVTVSPVAGASGDSAIAAKKKKNKCKGKKKKKRSAATAKKKKKKCKKKKKPAAQSPLVRATLTWSGGGDSTDYDLYVFDSNGTKARAVSNPIPNSTFSPNATGGSGSEAFTDLAPNPARNFSFGLCHQDGGTDGSSYTIEYVTADGVHHTDAQSGNSDGFNAVYTGAPPPATNTFTCPAP
jgi:hypothetical protein